MKCANCGCELENEALFCSQCGRPVPGTGSSAVRQIDASQASGRKQRARTQAIIVGVLCVLAAAVVIFAIVALGVGRTSSATPSSSAPGAAIAQSASSASGSSASSGSAASSKSKSSTASKSKSSKSAKKFIQADAEEKARDDAREAGMQVFSGTIRMTTYGKRAADVAPKFAKSFARIADEQLALLVFSMAETISATSADGSGQVQTRQGQECLALGNPWEWSEFDGQLVTVAAYPDDLVFPADASSKLYSAGGGVELIAPLTQESAAALTHEHTYTTPLPVVETIAAEEKSSSSAAASASPSSAASQKASDDGYFLPDSASRVYSKNDLSKYSDHDLFIARNEIYARHGHEFQNAELREYFGAKSWYHPVSGAEETPLNDTELANAATMRQIEESRGSKYL